MYIWKHLVDIEWEGGAVRDSPLLDTLGTFHNISGLFDVHHDSYA